MGNPEKINNEVTQKVAIVGLHKIPADFYLYNKIVDLTITSAVAIDDLIINTSSTVGLTNGDVITFYEGSWIFQNIVKSFTANTVTLNTKIDYAFTTSAIVETGAWNMAVNGSVTPQVFSFKAPITGIINVHTINVSMLDASDMDDGKYGGLTQLANGVDWRFVDGVTKHLAVIVNNLGFKEIGFDLDYTTKAPAGQYGLHARRYINKINGTILYLSGDGTFEVHINDDLTGLLLHTVTINGHFNG